MAPRSKPLAGELCVGKSVSTAMTWSGTGEVGPLRAVDNLLPDAHVEVRIFGVGFFVSAHARIAVQLHHQSGEHVDADGSRLCGRGRVNRSHQVKIERTADGQALRERSSPRDTWRRACPPRLAEEEFSGVSG